MFTKRIPLEERFAAKFTKLDDNKCWIWTGALNNSGYGSIKRGGRHSKDELAHRIAYELAFGAPPHDKLVCHKCDVRHCVNPNHLFLGTVLDNNRDRDVKGRCGAKGERPGEQCQHSKLKNEQVIAIRIDTTHTHDQLAVMFGVKRPTITNIKRRRTWAHI